MKHFVLLCLTLNCVNLQVKLMSVCPSVARAKGLLQLPQDSMEAAEAQELICLVNGWGMEELNTHVEWVRSRQAEMDVEGWEVKL